MERASAVCKRCGQCCMKVDRLFSTAASEEDVERWRREGRQDILNWISIIMLGKDVGAYDIWFNPHIGSEMFRCPWLKQRPDGTYACRIHATKPEQCRAYPAGIDDAAEIYCAAAPVTQGGRGDGCREETA